MVLKEKRSVWRVVALGLCVCLAVSVAGAEVVFITPVEGVTPITEGELFDIIWEGGDGNSTLQLWHGTEYAWEILPGGEEFPDYAGKYTWDSAGAVPGYHAFGAWVQTGQGDWYKAEGNGLVQVIPPYAAEDPINITSPEDESGDSVIKGEGGYEITWTGGSDRTSMQLWVGADNNWTELDEVGAMDNASKYCWDTDSDQFPVGDYKIGAWVEPGNGDDWYETYAVGEVTIFIPEPATVGLLVVGAVGVLIRGRRRRTA